MDHTLGQALTAAGILIELRIPPPRAIALVARHTSTMASIARAMEGGADSIAALAALGSQLDDACLSTIRVGGEPAWLFQHIGWYVGADGILAKAIEGRPADQRLMAARFLLASAVMIGAGNPLVATLDACSSMAKLAPIGATIRAIGASVKRSTFFGESARGLLPEAFADGVLLGELTGTLDAVLIDLMNHVTSELAEELGVPGPAAMKEEAHRIATSSVRREVLQALERFAPLAESKRQMLEALEAPTLTTMVRVFERG